MSDQPQSTAQPWRESPLRELYLHLLPADMVDAFRRVGELLYLMTLEYSAHWPNPAENDTDAELRAIVADLRFLEGFLQLSIAPDGADLHEDDPEARLPRLAARWAARIEMLAQEIEGDIAA